MSSLVPLWITIGIVCVAIAVAVAVPLALKGERYVDVPVKPLPDPVPIPSITNGPLVDLPLTKTRVKLPAAPSGQVVAVSTTLTEAYALVDAATTLKLAYWQGSSNGTWTLINQLSMVYQPGPYAMSSDETGVTWCAGGSAWQAFLAGGSLGSPVQIGVTGNVTGVIDKSLLVDGSIRVFGDSPGVVAQVWNPTLAWATGPGWAVSGTIMAVADGTNVRIYSNSGTSWAPVKSDMNQGSTVVGLDMCMDGRVLVVTSSAGTRMYRWNGTGFTGGPLVAFTGAKRSASDDNGQVTAVLVGSDVQVRYNDLSKPVVGGTPYTVKDVGDSTLKFFGRTLRTFIPGTVEWNEIMT